MSKGFGRTQRAILRHLTSDPSWVYASTMGITMAITPGAQDEMEYHNRRPAVSRALWNLQRSGLVEHRGYYQADAFSNGRSSAWAITGRGAEFAQGLGDTD